ncbi:unnamed protein product [Mytilus edulis]|uniref:Uncharacterized protein n=1 Tax=Mytilus edulis TaxID=6550 RepID=A0A8S3TTU1_MYTED|nr:unnamed protein product [Mytilus edulis]
MTSSRLNFEIPARMTEENYNDLTGLSKKQFGDLLGYMSIVKSSGVRSVRTCLGVYLTNLRVGLSDKILGTVFGLKISQIKSSEIQFSTSKFMGIWLRCLFNLYDKREKQLITNEANLTRVVTYCRWVVESTNARLKQFHFFKKVVSNTMISNIGDLVKITGGILKKYKRPLVSNPENEEVAKKMLGRSVLENSLQTYVEENNLIRRRTVYLPINAINFTKLTKEMIRDISLGIYQLKKAPGYTREHLSVSGNYESLFCKESETLLQVKIQSIHSKSTIHALWIDYNVDSKACIWTVLNMQSWG